MQFARPGFTDATSEITLRNCLLVAVTNIQSYIGSNNPAYGNAHASIPTGLFQQVGAGNYYLAAGSPHRNVGVTSIDSRLARELRTLTTYPPLVLTTDFTAATTLAPQAQRDSDTPDRGYHYPSLDYQRNNGVESIDLTFLLLLRRTALSRPWLVPCAFSFRGLVSRKDG